jgi:hypothetical protein
MSNDHERLSDLARRYFAHKREQNWLQGYEEGMRYMIVELMCVRLPGVRNELEMGLREQPAVRLTQLAGELGKAQSEDEVRAILRLH